MFEDECEIVERDTSIFDYHTFKKVLFDLMENKKIVVVDLTSEYTKHMKK